MRKNAPQEESRKSEAICKESAQIYCAPSKPSLDYMTVICAIRIFLLLQGARLGVAVNLTLDQVDRASRCRGFYVIRIDQRKTASSQGPACVALPATQINLLKPFVAIRRKLPFLGSKVITTVTGREPPCHRSMFGPC